MHGEYQKYVIKRTGAIEEDSSNGECAITSCSGRYFASVNQRKMDAILSLFPGGRQKWGVYPEKRGAACAEAGAKSYDEKIVKLTEKRLSQIGKILKDYDDEEIQAIYNNEHKERQCFIQPVDTWLMRAIEQEATLQNL